MIFKHLFNQKKVVPLDEYLELRNKYNKLSANFKDYKDKMEMKLKRLNREIKFLEMQNDINKKLILEILPYTSMTKDQQEAFKNANEKHIDNIFNK